MKHGEWGHKKENRAKHACFHHCKSENPPFNLHNYIKDECIEDQLSCRYLPISIVCNGLHTTSYKDCPVRLVYSKTKNVIQKPMG